MTMRKLLLWSVVPVGCVVGGLKMISGPSTVVKTNTPVAIQAPAPPRLVVPETTDKREEEAPLSVSDDPRTPMAAPPHVPTKGKLAADETIVRRKELGGIVTDVADALAKESATQSDPVRRRLAELRIARMKKQAAGLVVAGQ